MLSRQIADKLTQYETPFYLYDISLLRQTLSIAVSAAGKYGYLLHFAIKSNYDPKVLSVIKEYGLGIDCASGNEVRCALEAGFGPDTIVYAGVGKKDSEIRYAIEQDILSINCESLQEIRVVNDIASELGKTARVALRINPDVDPKTNSCINTGQADTKFGISYEEALAKSKWILSLPCIEVVGMHLHIGSQIREMSVFEDLCDKVNVIAANLRAEGFDFRFVDVGGGLGINYEAPEDEPVPDFASVFSIVNSHLKVGGVPVHFEFGRAIVGECAELITKVLYEKTTATGRKLIIVDSSMTELLRPALYGAYHDIENITSAQGECETYTVVGTACESTDVFVRDHRMKLTSRGDLLSIKSAGAYGMSMASRYIQHDLPGAVYSDEI